MGWITAIWLNAITSLCPIPFLLGKPSTYVDRHQLYDKKQHESRPSGGQRPRSHIIPRQDGDGRQQEKSFVIILLQARALILQARVVSRFMPQQQAR